ncbi:hypothetical protein MMC30_000832 [Trapelia coarctata]|nr:hypothetical protein [Trapelia coarctata]
MASPNPPPLPHSPPLGPPSASPPQLPPSQLSRIIQVLEARAYGHPPAPALPTADRSKRRFLNALRYFPPLSTPYPSFTKIPVQRSRDPSRPIRTRRHDSHTPTPASTIRTTPVQHAITVAHRTRVITRQRDPVAGSGGTAAAVAQRVFNKGSPRVVVADGSYPAPDASFAHYGAAIPAVVVVIEPASSQCHLAVVEAKEYLTPANGLLRALRIGRWGDDTAEPSLSARLSVLRLRSSSRDGMEACAVEEVAIGEGFCGGDGDAVGNAKAELRVRLDDFADRGVVEGYGGMDAVIRVSARALFECVDFARRWVAKEG